MRKLNKQRLLLTGILILLVSVATASELPFGKGMLFSVIKDGATPSYVFGTVHSDDERVVRLPRQVQDAFDSSKHVVVEVEMDESALLLSAATLIFSDGRDLPSVLGKSLYKRTAAAMEKRGIPEIALRQFKPWAVVTMMSVPPPKTGQFLDLMIYRSARDRGIKTTGLETVAEQLSVFERLSDSEQILLLKQALNNLDELPIIFEKLIKAYLNRDLAGLMRISNEMNSYGSPELEKKFMNMLVDSRNKRMAERLDPMLKKGGVFVAVGALHLPGKQGILSLLQGLGYSVERKY